MTFDATFSLRLTLTLLHSLWQGGAIVVVAAIVMARLDRSTARVRYTVLIVAQLLLGLCLVVTYMLVQPLPYSFDGPSLIAQGSPKGQPASGLPPAGRDPTSIETDRLPIRADVQRAPVVYSQYIALAYVLCVGAMLVRLLIGVRGGSRLVRASEPITEGRILVAIARGVQAMKMAYTPAIAYCGSIVVPCVVGILRPTLLIPLSVTSGLPTSELEVLVMHELAHICRYDHFLNLFQRIMEAFCFFNPSVWYLSHRIRLERELCCDDMVIAAGGNAPLYAKALARMIERASQDRIVGTVTLVHLGATGDGPALRRIARLLGASDPKTRLKPLNTLALGLLSISALFALVGFRIPDRMTAAGASSATIAEPTAGTGLTHAATPADWTPLHIAAAYGTPREAAVLIQQQKNLDVRESQGWTPLHLAIGKYRQDIAGMLLDGTADINARNNLGQGALHIALAMTSPFVGPRAPVDEAMVRFLLGRHANPNLADKKGFTPLHGAILARNVAMAQTLLQLGANANSRDANQFTPLHHACVMANPQIIQTLLSYGADVQAVDYRGWSALDMLALQIRTANSPSAQDVASCTQVLMSAGARPTFSAAVALGLHSQVVQMLHDDPLLANTQVPPNPEKYSPLHWAATSADAQMCDLLLNAGADVNAVGASARTPLHAALNRRDPQLEIVQRLLASGAAVNAPDKQKETPLHFAVMRNDPTIVESLILMSADVNGIDGGSNTPLHLAVSAHARKLDPASLAIVQVLLRSKADPNIASADGRTPLHVAVAASRDELVLLLLDAGANPNAQDKTGRTPLHAAVGATEPSISIIRALLDHGADPNVRDLAGASAAGIAEKLANRQIAGLMPSSRPAR